MVVRAVNRLADYFFVAGNRKVQCRVFGEYCGVGLQRLYLPGVDIRCGEHDVAVHDIGTGIGPAAGLFNGHRREQVVAHAVGDAEKPLADKVYLGVRNRRRRRLAYVELGKQRHEPPDERHRARIGKREILDDEIATGHKREQTGDRLAVVCGHVLALLVVVVVGHVNAEVAGV